MTAFRWSLLPNINFNLGSLSEQNPQNTLKKYIWFSIFNSIYYFIIKKHSKNVLEYSIFNSLHVYSRPNERITPHFRTKKNWKLYVWQDERDATDLQSCLWSRESQLVWPEYDTKTLSEDSGPRTHFLLNRMATPWNNLPKDVALASSVKKLNLYLKKVARNMLIYP